jgi:hypothetical protein
MTTRILKGMLIGLVAAAATVSAAVPATAGPDGGAAAVTAPAKHGKGASSGPAALGGQVTKGTEYGKSGVVRTQAAYTYVGDHVGRTGRCSYALCLYWDSNARGAGVAFSGSISDFAGYTYPNTGTGAGQRVKNNAASVEAQGNGPVQIYYNENWSGPMDWLNTGTWGNLVQTWNDNASASICC